MGIIYAKFTGFEQNSVNSCKFRIYALKFHGINAQKGRGLIARGFQYSTPQNHEFSFWHLLHICKTISVKKPLQFDKLMNLIQI